MEHLAKGIHFVAGYNAIGLGHFGAQHNHADGEGNLLGGVAVRLFIVVGIAVRHVTGKCTDHRANGSAQRHAADTTDYFAPDTHGALIRSLGQEMKPV